VEQMSSKHWHWSFGHICKHDAIYCLTLLDLKGPLPKSVVSHWFSKHTPHVVGCGFIQEYMTKALLTLGYITDWTPCGVFIGC
jgi:hypothetical protein